MFPPLDPVESQGIDGHGYEEDDGVADGANQIRQRSAGGQKSGREGELQQGVEAEVDRHAPQDPQDDLPDAGGVLELHVFSLEQVPREEAHRHAEAGEVVVGLAVEPAGQQEQEEDKIEHPAPFEFLLEIGYHQDHEQAQSPAEEHVRGEVDAHAEPADAHQQREDDGHGPSPFLLQKTPRDV